MINMFEKIFTWLTEINGSVRGVPTPNWYILICFIFVCICVVTEVIKIIKKNRHGRKDDDHRPPENDA
jgi:hypothetical protein